MRANAVGVALLTRFALQQSAGTPQELRVEESLVTGRQSKSDNAREQRGMAYSSEYEDIDLRGGCRRPESSERKPCLFVTPLAVGTFDVQLAVVMQLRA